MADENGRQIGRMQADIETLKTGFSRVEDKIGESHREIYGRLGTIEQALAEDMGRRKVLGRVLGFVQAVFAVILGWLLWGVNRGG